MIITEKQRERLNSLFPEHGEALVNYGADMYRRGLVTGAVWFAMGASCGFAITGLRKIYECRKNKKVETES